MGLGNLFSSAVEDLLLYVVAPVTTIGLAVGIGAAQRLVSQRLGAGAESWRDPLAPRVASSDADYRAPASASAAPEVPATVRRLVRFGVLWSAATLVAFVVLATVTLAVAGPCMALPVPLTAALASVLMLRACITLPDRGASGALARLDGARAALLVHHGVLLTLGTLLVGLLVLSDTYFWNSPLERGVDRLAGLAFGYGALVLAPCLVGLGLARWLRSVRALYVAAPPD